MYVHIERKGKEGKTEKDRIFKTFLKISAQKSIEMSHLTR